MYTNLGMVGMIAILETDRTKGISWTCLCVLLDGPFLFLLHRLTGKPTIIYPRMVSNQPSAATSQNKTDEYSVIKGIHLINKVHLGTLIRLH